MIKDLRNMKLEKEKSFGHWKLEFKIRILNIKYSTI